MSLQLHYTGQDYGNRGLLQGATLVPGSTSSISNTCKTGNGFVFDGTEDSSMSSSIIVNDSLNQSFSFWFKFTGTELQKNLLSLQGSATGLNNTRLLIRITAANTLAIGQRIVPSQAYSQTNSPIAFEVDTWYHMVVILKELESKIDIYVNGVYLYSHTWSGTLATSNQRFVWGKRALDNNLEPFSGSICNFKYYDHALSMKEIREDYKSLILHYPLGSEWYRNTVRLLDNSGFQNDLIISNRTTTFSTLSEKYEGSEQGNGSQYILGTRDLTFLNNRKEISIQFWFRRTGTLTTNTLCNRTLLGNGISIFILNNQIYIDLGTRKTYTITTPLNEWNHLCVTQSETEQKLYVNNILQAPQTSTTIINVGSILSLAASQINGSSFGNYLVGQMNDLRIYATELTAADVNELYRTRHELDKDGNLYTGEVVETESGNVEMKRNSILNTQEVNEVDFDTSMEILTDEIRTNNIKEI